MLRECYLCKGSDVALLSRELNNDRTILLTNWFHCVKLPANTTAADHPVWVQFARSMVMTIMGERAMLELRSRLFGHVQRLGLRFFDSYPVGRLVTRITHDPETLVEMFSAGIVMLIADLLRMLGFALALFWLDWRLALVSMAVVPPLALGALVFRYKVRQAYREVRIWIARINANLQESISGMRVVPENPSR